jgi:uncharacterized protein GlcG (DUF336 family)
MKLSLAGSPSALPQFFCRHGRRTGNAYTALTSGVPSGEFAKRMKENPKDVIAGQGGLPIKSAEEVIGAVGMSGVPNGADKEEACAQAAIDRVVDQLK